MYTLFTTSSILLLLFFASPFFLPLPFTRLTVTIEPLVNPYSEGSLHPWILPSLYPQQQDGRGCCGGEERLITTGPIEAWLHLHLHHWHRFREENQELEEETAHLATGPKAEWVVIHPITPPSHLSIIPTAAQPFTAELPAGNLCFSVRNVL